MSDSNKTHRNVEATIIADSVNPNGERLTSFILRYPRFLHSEIMTHRALSRNAASSRAIPSAKMRSMVATSPAHPEFWGANKSGMQAHEQLDDMAQLGAKSLWFKGAKDAAALNQALESLGVHKQIANRVLEPYLPYTTLASATEWANFFALRAHKDAQPEFQVLAYRMLNAYLSNQPKECDWGEWHMPFSEHMPDDFPLEKRIKVATARAARLSYMTFDGDIDPEKDFALYNNLVGSCPLHASPTEHIAVAGDYFRFALSPVTPRVTPDVFIPYIWTGGKSPRGLSTGVSITGKHQGNFIGWTQHRKTLANENVQPQEINLHDVLANKPTWFEL